MQELSKEICKEYQQKVQRQKNTDFFGNWKLQREFGHELQSKCNIPQIWALNIVNGYYIQDYLAIHEYRKREIDFETEKQNRKYYEELLQEEDRWMEKINRIG